MMGGEEKRVSSMNGRRGLLIEFVSLFVVIRRGWNPNKSSGLQPVLGTCQLRVRTSFYEAFKYR